MEEKEFNKKLPREKPEDFIGWKSEDGNLEVIEIDRKLPTGRSVFRVTCKICSPDTELYPLGYFVSQKHHLKDGKKPCGCSSSPRWDEYEFLVKACRAGEDKGITVHGYAEPFKGSYTKLDCECKKDNYKWKVSLFNILNTGNGCPKCSNKVQPTEQEAFDKCACICTAEGYEFLGFINGYKNQNSRLKYRCTEHGITETDYNNFVNGNRRCKGCAKSGYNVNIPGYLYVVKWSKLNEEFLKFGITNRKVKARIEEQTSGTEYSPELLYARKWDNGKIPLSIEHYIKHSNIIDIKIITKDKFQDGFTETTHMKNLELILKIAENHNNYVSV